MNLIVYANRVLSIVQSVLHSHQIFYWLLTVAELVRYF